MPHNTFNSTKKRIKSSYTEITIVNYWLLSLCLFNVLLLAFIGFNHLSQKKSKAEDHRLTKGLQLLQNKISILQDLSDKTDEQVRKWVHIIEQKSHDIQHQLHASDEKIIQIEEVLSKATEKAIEASQIFYERVPHAEMAEREKTSKYVRVAKLANQGLTTEEISQQIDLSIAEIEMITKMNREELQFSEKNLPTWAQVASKKNDEKDINFKGSSSSISNEYRARELTDFATQMQQLQQTQKISQMVSTTAFDVTAPDLSSMNQIKQEFKAAVTDTLAMNSTQIPQTFLDDKVNSAAVTTKTPSGKIVRPFEFRRIVKS